MRYILENEMLKVEIDSLGAEIKSVVNKTTGQEYMYHVLLRVLLRLRNIDQVLQNTMNNHICEL